MPINVEVNINTNNYNGGETQIEQGAIEKFTRKAFDEGSYQASVKFECMPAAISPNTIWIIISNIEQGAHVVEIAFTIAKIAKEVINLLERCSGYDKTVELANELIGITDEMTDIELEGKILAILNEQEKKTGKEVSEIMKTM